MRESSRQTGQRKPGKQREKQNMNQVDKQKSIKDSVQGKQTEI